MTALQINRAHFIDDLKPHVVLQQTTARSIHPSSGWAARVKRDWPPTHPFRGGISYHTTLLYRHLRRRHDTAFYAFARQYPAWLFGTLLSVDGALAAGIPGVRIMETHEHYHRQHQDIRVEDGIEYGDVIEGVNFDYARKLTGLNVVSLAGMAMAPPFPANVQIEGAVQPSTTLSWDLPSGKAAGNLAGYELAPMALEPGQWVLGRRRRARGAAREGGSDAE